MPAGSTAGRGILAHELAHLARGDHWVVRLELLVEAVWWWNPLFWIARRRIHEEAELACDAWVVRAPRAASMPTPRPWSATICEHIARSAIPSHSLGVGGALGRPHSLEGRLHMILRDPDARYRPECFKAALLAAAPGRPRRYPPGPWASSPRFRRPNPKHLRPSPRTRSRFRAEAAPATPSPPPCRPRPAAAIFPTPVERSPDQERNRFPTPSWPPRPRPGRAWVACRSAADIGRMSRDQSLAPPAGAGASGGMGGEGWAPAAWAEGYVGGRGSGMGGAGRTGRRRGPPRDWASRPSTVWEGSAVAGRRASPRCRSRGPRSFISRSPT